jgi:integrase
MAKRPDAFEVSPARVRVKRGPDAEGRWYWRADRPDGRGGRVDVWTGWATKAEAAAAVRANLDARPEQRGAEIETVGDLLDCWLGSVRVERPDAADRTRLAIESAVVRLLAYGLADLHLRALNREAMAAHVRASRDAKRAGGTVQRDLTYLRQAWRWGQELDPAPVPLRALPRVRVDTAPVYTRYTPTADEVRGLLDGVAPRFRPGLILLAATGCRIGEVMSLTWGRVTLDCRSLLVDGKTGERRVEVHSVVAAEIARWPRGAADDRVVTVSDQAIREALVRRSTAMGIGRCSPNSLRRHVVDALYESAQGDPKAAGSQLGHSPLTAITHYRTVREAKRRAVVEGADLGVVLVFPVQRDEEAG